MAVKYFQVRMEPEEYEELKKKWEAAGFSGVQEAGMHALTHADWGQEGPEAAIPGKYRPYMRKLAKILSSGREKIIDGVIRNLDLFDELREIHESRKPR